MNTLLTSFLVFMLLFSVAVFAAEDGAGAPEVTGAPEDAGNEVTLPDDAMPQVTSTGTPQGNPDVVGEQVQERMMMPVQDETMNLGEGKELKIQTQANNKVKLESKGKSAETGLELTHDIFGEVTMLKAKLSNGKNADVKVMPDAASEKAIEKLQLKNCAEEDGCKIELKEVGTGENVRAAYEVKAKKKAKLFGLFGTEMDVEAQIDAETGEVISSHKPWWAFLASENKESDDVEVTANETVVAE